METGPTQKFLPIALIVMAVGSVHLLSGWWGPSDAFWVVDNGCKFLQTEAILAHDYQDASIPWPGVRIDPEFRYNPLPRPFSVVREGRLYSVFSPVFATLSTVPYRLFGFGGLHLIPWLGALATLLGVVRLAARIGVPVMGRGLTALAVGLATPVWFYASVFWEHTPAVALCVWGMSFFLDSLDADTLRPAVLGGACTGMAIAFRDELYLLCPVLVGSLLVYASGSRWSKAGAAGLSMILAVVPLWLFQGWLIGEPFGFHLGSHLFSVTGLREHIEGRVPVFYNLFVAWGPVGWTSVALAAPFLISFLAFPKLYPAVHARVSAGMAGVAAALGLLVLLGGWRASEPMAWLNASNSFFPAAPWLILAFWVPREPESKTRPRGVELLQSVALFYAVLYGIVAPQVGSAGIHWGNRFLLVLYPLLGVLALRNVTLAWGTGVGRRSLILGLSAVFLVSASAQVESIRLLVKKKNFGRRLQMVVEGRAEPVVLTNEFWVPAELTKVFSAKPIFYVSPGQVPSDLLARLREEGVERFLFVTSQPPPGHEVIERVDDGGLGAFSVSLLSVAP